MRELQVLFDDDANAAANMPTIGHLTLDQLDYMCDLVAELRVMAAGAGMTTLAAILALAQTEATQQALARRT